MPKTYQVAAIPVRRSRAGATEVLLVTSRETRRWVVPKGWPWDKTADHEAAAGEAWEEAGVKGHAGRISIGTFTYAKTDKGKSKLLEVRAFLLEVVEEFHIWPESAQRRREWFPIARAAELVAEPELKALLLEVADALSSARRQRDHS